MSATFNADDILQIAEKIERNGAQFYRKAAELPCDPDTKQVLINLAVMEDEHEKTFAGIRESLSLDLKKPTAFDPDDEEQAYLMIMADRNVFDVDINPADKLRGKERMDEIFKMAIGLEKESIVFYNRLKKFVPGNFGADKVDEIIAEEYSHIDMLSSKLRSV